MKVIESKLRMGWVKMDRHCRGSSSSFKASKQERSWQVLSSDGIPSVGAQRISDSPPRQAWWNLGRICGFTLNATPRHGDPERPSTDKCTFVYMLDLLGMKWGGGRGS